MSTLPNQPSTLSQPMTDPNDRDCFPPAPTTADEAGLSQDLLIQLVLKTLHFAGELTGVELALRLGLNFSVVEPAVTFLKEQRHCEIAGGTMIGPVSYRYRITDAGRSRASLFLHQNHYVGAAPVPLAQYHRYMSVFWQLRPQRVTRDLVRRAFSHLVLSERLLDQLGPAINAGHSIFVYGPPGNGKTVIAQALRKLLPGQIAIPYALEVEGSIVRFFDPVNHQPVSAVEDEDSTETRRRRDRRWVRCHRPLVTVGGELALDSLDLSYSSSSGFYRAPVQAIANGGVLVIDDFGRQRCSPRELLNRWIVPLESRIDYLTLQTGQKFELPFMVLLVFATNIDPGELVDEAFLRRIHFKVQAENPTAEDFAQIFERCCRDRGIPFERELVDRLLEEYYRPRRIALRGCQPRDLITQALALAAYLDQPRRLTKELLEAACDTYFVNERPARMSGPAALETGPNKTSGACVGEVLEQSAYVQPAA